MAESRLSDIEKKKLELEQELSEIQNGIDQSIDDVKEGVSTSFDPKNIIKKYPLPAVGLSILAGFLLGKSPNNSSVSSKRSSNRFTEPDSGISKEIKRVLAKKGLSLMLDFLENKVSALKEKQDTPQD